MDIEKKKGELREGFGKVKRWIAAEYKFLEELKDELQAIRSERDGDGDGQVETWYYYQKGRLVAVKEDINKDGKPDLWEKYNESEILVKRSKDLNFDGTPDIKDNTVGQVRKVKE